MQGLQQQSEQRRLVGVTEAARALGLNPSTVSRQLGRVFPNHGTEAKPLVDVDEARSMRAAQLDPVKQRGRGLLLEQPAATPAPAAEPTGPRRLSDIDRKRQADADIAELDAAKAKGQVVDRSRVQAAQREAGQAIREALKSRNRGLAAQLVGKTDPREIAALLDESDHALLVRVASTLDGMAETAELTEEDDHARAA